ncbi:hypothetical protein PBAL39_24515 [Pedobacter sp. BAL39]|uniref:hypothetical protein n=1 Tax=Pedobacter sp. BAL39 TaxID=391596 RepID=UPI000155A6DD|nr:hypothetical protein [Pedobacter sp. BAL39]EDM33969.1 hypothetical protein PBAL39_24515 [Pedobacter sp. BAL39]
MKKIMILYTAMMMVFIFQACDRTEDPIYEKISDDHFPTIISNTNFVSPSVPAAGFAKGTALKIELNFISVDPVKEIQFLEKTGTADSVVIQTVPYAPAFSRAKNCDTLVYNYTVPSAPEGGTQMGVRARVVNVNGLTKDRTFTYKIKVP